MSLFFIYLDTQRRKKEEPSTHISPAEQQLYPPCALVEQISPSAKHCSSPQLFSFYLFFFLF